MTVQSRRTEQNILVGERWEQMIAKCGGLVLSIHPQAKGSNEQKQPSPLLSGSLVDQHLMAHDWSERLRVAVFLSKLFLMGLINVALA